MQKKNHIIGIVLAGGKSSRMGQEKGLIKYKNKTLIEYVIESITPFCDNIIISSSNKEYKKLGLSIIEDEIPDCGPLGGIYSAMKNTNADNYLVVSCDLPFISQKLLKNMISICDEWDAIIPVDWNNRVQPLCACYGRSFLPNVQNAIKNGEFKIIRALKDLDVNFFSIKENSSLFSSLMFYNVNFPSDLNYINTHNSIAK
ncbi:MAG: molybdenum cofactor guanylyltransferase [Bacteroidales bacterium]|jgi:molybdopterin-guanine dinucleotide biosynthesis protein A|nr:molybdenum cofactor guanylyltransferase [Bacteroidales bacterium]